MTPFDRYAVVIRDDAHRSAETSRVWNARIVSVRAGLTQARDALTAEHARLRALDVDADLAIAGASRSDRVGDLVQVDEGEGTVGAGLTIQRTITHRSVAARIANGEFDAPERSGENVPTMGPFGVRNPDPDFNRRQTGTPSALIITLVPRSKTNPVALATVRESPTGPIVAQAQSQFGTEYALIHAVRIARGGGDLALAQFVDAAEATGERALHATAGGDLCRFGTNGCCDVCGAAGDPCDNCGGRGYHRAGCQEIA